MNRVLITLLVAVLFCTCNPQRKTSTYPDNFITSEIMVTMESESKVEELLLGFKKPVFKVKERISARMGIFLLVFDDTKYDPGKALIKLQEHSSVKSAEFNKKVGIRDQK